MTYSVAGDEKAWNAGIRMSKRHMRGSLAGRGRAVHRAVPEAPQQTQTSVAGWGALPADNNLATRELGVGPVNLAGVRSAQPVEGA